MRRPLVLVIILLAVPSLALAGCLEKGAEDLAPAAETPAADVPSATSAVVHLAGTKETDPRAIENLTGGLLPNGMPIPVGALRYSGGMSFEPTLGVDKDGNIYLSIFERQRTTPAGGSHSVNLLRKSTDQGLTWEDVTPRIPGAGTSSPPNSNDPYVYVDVDTGRIFLSDLQALVCSTLSFSDDGGKTWVTNPLGCGLPVGVHDHQTVFTAKSRGPLPTVGYSKVVYYCINRVADSACATSRNGGVTFGPLVTVFPGARATGAGAETAPGFCGGLHAHGAAAPDGTVYLPKGHCGVPMVGISKDDGATWKTVTITNEVRVKGHEVAFAVDEAGNAYAAWIGAEDRKPYVAASSDGGETWGAPLMVAPPGVATTDFPTLAAGADGRIVMAYYGTTADKEYGGMKSDDTWNGYMTVITDALSEAPVLATVTVNDPSDPLARGVCGNTRCNGVGDFIDVVIDGEGRPWAAFVDVCNDECAAADGDSNAGGNLGAVGTLAAGPRLRGPLEALPALLEAAPAAE